MQRLSDEAWADIARAWADGAESVAQIAARHRLFPAKIYMRAREEGWPPRGSRKPATPIPAPAPAAPPEPVVEPARSSDPAPDEETREALVRRLFKAIDLKLKHLEKRMASGKTVTAADSERQTRELNQMIRSFEKVTELARDRDTAAAGSAPAALTLADAERMRARIAERLGRLARGRQPRR